MSLSIEVERPRRQFGAPPRHARSDLIAGTQDSRAAHTRVDHFISPQGSAFSTLELASESPKPLRFIADYRAGVASVKQSVFAKAAPAARKQARISTALAEQHTTAPAETSAISEFSRPSTANAAIIALHAASVANFRSRRTTSQGLGQCLLVLYRAASAAEVQSCPEIR